MTTDRSRPDTVPDSRPAPPRHRLAAFLTLVVLGVVAWSVLTIDVEVTRLMDLPARLLTSLRLMFFPPDWGYSGRAMEGMVESIQIAWIGTIIGGLLSLPLGFLGAKNIGSGTLASFMRQILNAIRAIPELVLAVVVFIPIIGLGAFAGTMAIGIHSIGTLGKLTAEVVEGIDPGPVEAARAAGANQLQTLRWGVLPQVLPDVVAFWLYRFEINIRAAAILGVVGAGGVGAILQNTLAFRRWDKAGMTVVVVILATIAIDSVSGAIRRRIIEGADRRVTAAEVFEQPELAERAG